MIISASRRTDIPAFYSEWFLNRLREGFLLVRNPMNPSRVSRISLSPDDVDAIVFWTKNPIPMLDRIDELGERCCLFQFTLTDYGKDAEPGVPEKGKFLIPAFQRLAEKLSPEQVIWRFDPIFLTEKYTVVYHLYYFGEIASRLRGYTKKCTVSFLDLYRNTASRMEPLGLCPLTDADVERRSRGISEIASECGMTVESCAEEYELERFGIKHARCIDGALIERLTGRKISERKDKNQRKLCGCAASVDVGMYNTCRNGCLYCYANYSPGAVGRNFALHDKLSPLVCGTLRENDIVAERKL